METKINQMSKLDRLNMLYDTLALCKCEGVNDADEWNAYTKMMVRVKGMITEERRKLGWKAVYPIVNGCAQEALFEGTEEQCKIYVDIMKENNPKADVIILKL